MADSKRKYRSIYLLGFMGAGKTTVGKRLAKQLDYEFVDLDQLVRTLAGMTINDMFHKAGEQSFRKLEQTALKQLKGRERLVIATGGGTPCYYDNMDRMRENGYTIYLKAKPLTLMKRLRNDRAGRPLLRGLETDEQLLDFITRTLEQRKPFYHRAHLIYEI